MKTTQKMIYLGSDIQDRNQKDNNGVWQKTGEKYLLVNLLADDGKNIEIRVREPELQNMCDGLVQLDKVEVLLQITVSKYINIDILSLVKVK